MIGWQTALFRGRKLLAAMTVCACLVFAAGSALGETPTGQNPAELATLLAEQNSSLTRELRRIQREIAALRADLGKPGFQEIFGGIGYIFGIFGTAAFVASRRRDRGPNRPQDSGRN
ncbi:MAG: hypothetical protein WAK57_19535 [Desulfobacterales bacterium]